MNERERAILAIQAERDRQNDQWGEQNHAPEIYLAILVEEVGELAREMLQRRFAEDLSNLEREAIHAAAVAQALLECLYRNKWNDQL